MKAGHTGATWAGQLEPQISLPYVSASLFWVLAKKTNGQTFIHSCVCVCVLVSTSNACKLFHVCVLSMNMVVFWVLCMCVVYVSVCLLFLCVISIWKAAEQIGEEHKLRSRTAWVQTLDLHPTSCAISNPLLSPPSLSFLLCK